MKKKSISCYAPGVVVHFAERLLVLQTLSIWIEALTDRVLEIFMYHTGVTMDLQLSESRNAK